DPSDYRDTDMLGMELASALRISPLNNSCGLVVITAYPSSNLTRRAFRELGAHDFVQKRDFDPHRFLETVRTAILEAYLQQAVKRYSERYRLIIRFDNQKLISSETIGPNHQGEHQIDSRWSHNTNDLVRRADTINLLMLQDQAQRILWREEARSI